MFALTGVAYYLGASLGYRYSLPLASIVVVWPPSGMMLAALLLLNRRRWPLALAGAFAGNVAADLVHGTRVAIAFEGSAANLVEVLLAALVVIRLVGSPVRLTRLREVAALVLGAAVLSNALTALLGALVLVQGWNMRLPAAWFVWWTGDGMGMLIVAPAILATASLARTRSFNLRTGLEAIALLVGLVVFAQLALGHEEDPSRAFELEPYMVFPFLFWAAVRFGAHGATMATLILAVVTIWNASTGHVFFHVPGQAPTNEALRISAYLALASVSALVAASTLSERKAATDALTRLAAILDVTPDFVTIGQSAGPPLYINRAARLALGLDDDRPISSLYEVRPPGFQQRFEREILPAASAQGSWVGEAEYVTRDGRIIPVSQVTIVHSDAQGLPQYISTVARDITDRKRATLELTRLSAAIAAAADAVFVTDRNGVIRFVNPAFTQLYGYAPDEVIGRATPRILKSGRMPEEHYARLWHQLLSRQPANAEHVNRTNDGQLITVAASASPIVDESGELVGFVAIHRDLTAQKETEGQLRQAQKMQAVGQLAAGMAHDFNNILTAVMGYASLLAEAADTTAHQRADVVGIMHAGERAAGLTRQLLMFSRRQAIRRVALNLNAIIEGMAHMLHRTMGDQVEIVMRLDPEAGFVEADKTEMEQVLLNLTVNARDAMPAGGTLSITTENVDFTEDATRSKYLPASGRYVRMAVTDTGEGISSEVRAHLFEAFFTTKGFGKGTGLGLATVHGIVTENRGTIDVLSAPGQGATFAIYLPRVERADVESGETPVRRRTRGGGETILIAEDDGVIQKLTARILQQVGYTTLVSGNVPEALHVAASHPGRIDLLLTDVVMPGAGGIELAARLTRARPGLQVVFISGYTGQIDPRWKMEQAIRAHFVAKPFTAEQLLAEVRAALDDRAPAG